MFAFLLGLMLGGALGYYLTGFIEEEHENRYDDYEDWRRL